MKRLLAVLLICALVVPAFAEEPQNPVEEPQCQSVEEPQSQSVEEPQSQSVEEPQSQSVEEPQSQSAEEPQGQPAEESQNSLAEAPKSQPIVWFVHGMIVDRDTFEEELEALRKTFPDAESVTLKKWNSPKLSLSKLATAWSISLEESEKFAVQLADELQQLPDEQRQRLVLVGHSLGARISVRALAICADKGVKIRQLILAGSAIDNDDPDIAKAITASSETVYSVINPNDGLLLVYKVAGEQHSALGTGYLFVQPPERFCEVLMPGTVDHYGYKYLQRFQECHEKGDFTMAEVIVPQDYTNTDFPTMGGYFFWDELDEQDGWRLQQYHATGHCRILDANGVRRAWGRLKNMRPAFEKVKVQLNHLKAPEGDEAAK